MTSKEIKIELFESHIFVFWDCNPKEVAKYCKKKLKGLPDRFIDWLNNNYAQGVCLTDIGNSANCLIWISQSPLKKGKGISLLAHEASHAAYAIMKHWSIDVDDNSSELIAMITGFIVEKIK